MHQTEKNVVLRFLLRTGRNRIRRRLRRAVFAPRAVEEARISHCVSEQQPTAAVGLDGQM